MNLDNSNPIVEENNIDFLWHSNNALREELAKAKKKIKELQESKV
jgi:hypothetical protein|tara:strand:+ start:96 stop:230 length:135 start_codon:yes stop_codon:yes gene_type:complete